MTTNDNLMTETSLPPDRPLTNSADSEISVFDLLIVLAKNKFLILGAPLVTAVVVAVYSLTLPPAYKAITKILPPQQSQSAASAVLAQLGGALGTSGAGGLTGGKGSNELYIAMLKSQAVANNLIERFELIKLWGIDAKHPSDIYEALSGRAKISSSLGGLIDIEVEDKDPKFAAALANAFVEELFKYTSTIAVTEAAQRRLFYERQLALAKENLTKAEIAARQALLTGGVIRVDAQGSAIVETTTRLRTQISAKEVQIGTMRAFAGDRNPDLQLALQEIESMKRQLAKIEESGVTKAVSNGNTGKGFDNLALLRDVKYYEVIFDLLARQFEMAKIDEAKDAAIIQVIDKAIEPDRRSKPRRTIMVLISSLLMGFVAVLLAFLREGLEKASTHPQKAARMLALKRYLAWR